MAKILVLEDAKDGFEIIKSSIDASHVVINARTVQEGKKLFSGDIDLLVLDVGLPDGDGFEYCGWVRSQQTNSQIPILFVSAYTSVESCITGLMSGGDDYIYKPFHVAELKARIESKLRQSNNKKQYDLNIEYGGVGINLRTQKAYIKDTFNKMTELDLTPIEYKILQIFIEEPESAHQRDKILDKIWGDTVYVYPRSVDTHVSKLRKKLCGKAEQIKSVHGRGYRFTSGALKNINDVIAEKMTTYTV